MNPRHGNEWSFDLKKRKFTDIHKAVHQSSMLTMTKPDYDNPDCPHCGYNLFMSRGSIDEHITRCKKKHEAKHGLSLTDQTEAGALSLAQIEGGALSL